MSRKSAKGGKFRAIGVLNSLSQTIKALLAHLGHEFKECFGGPSLCAIA